MTTKFQIDRAKSLDKTIHVNWLCHDLAHELERHADNVLWLTVVCEKSPRWSQKRRDKCLANVDDYFKPLLLAIFALSPARKPRVRR
jgi:hypothetical protein